MPKTKAQLNAIAKKIKRLKAIDSLPLSKTEKGYVHSMVKHFAVQAMTAKRKKK